MQPQADDELKGSVSLTSRSQITLLFGGYIRRGSSASPGSPSNQSKVAAFNVCNWTLEGKAGVEPASTSQADGMLPLHHVPHVAAVIRIRAASE